MLSERGNTIERCESVWTQTVVARDVDTHRIGLTLRLDARQRPVVVPGHSIAGRPEVRVFRPR